MPGRLSLDFRTHMQPRAVDLAPVLKLVLIHLPLLIMIIPPHPNRDPTSSPGYLGLLDLRRPSGLPLLLAHLRADRRTEYALTHITLWLPRWVGGRSA